MKVRTPLPTSRTPISPHPAMPDVPAPPPPLHDFVEREKLSLLPMAVRVALAVVVVLALIWALR